MDAGLRNVAELTKALVATKKTALKTSPGTNASVTHKTDFKKGVNDILSSLRGLKAKVFRRGFPALVVDIFRFRLRFVVE